MISPRAPRIALLGSLLIALVLGSGASASGATAIHFQRESLSSLKAQLHRHEVHAVVFHPKPTPGHVHVSMNDGRHYTAVYVAGEQAALLALARADGSSAAVAEVKAKPASAHHLRYIAGGILIVVIAVVAAVLLVDRRRKLREQEAQGTPDASTPAAPGG
jgi:hypothetical protein